MGSVPILNLLEIPGYTPSSYGVVSILLSILHIVSPIASPNKVRSYARVFDRPDCSPTRGVFYVPDSFQIFNPSRWLNLFWMLNCLQRSTPWASYHSGILYCTRFHPSRHTASQTQSIQTHLSSTPSPLDHSELKVSLLSALRASPDIPFLLAHYISKAFRATIASSSICWCLEACIFVRVIRCILIWDLIWTWGWRCGIRYIWVRICILVLIQITRSSGARTRIVASYRTTSARRSTISIYSS